MKFKIEFLWLTVLLIITYNVNSQTAPITTVGSAIACSNDTIILPVTATNCPCIGGIALELDYNASVLSYINLNPMHDTGNFYNTNSPLYATGGDMFMTQVNFVTGFKRLQIGWSTQPGAIPLSIGNIAHLFDIPFRYYGGNTSIILNNSSGNYLGCEYDDCMLNAYIDTPTVNYYINGTVTQVTAPAQPGVINGYLQPVIGDTTVYSVANDSGVSYTWSAPSAWYGNSSSSSITYVVGSDTGTIIVTPSNCSGAGPPRTLNVIPMNGNTIKGNLTYDNIACTPLDSAWMFLKLNGTTLDSEQTTANGRYQFNVTNNGAYNITATTHKPWGGVNSTDAVKVKRHFSGSELLTSSIRLHAADVNASSSINVTDAVKITRRFVGTDTSFEKGDWVFEKPLGGDTINVSYINDSLIVNGNNVVQNFKGLCVGDVNGSNLPLQGAKEGAKVELRSDKVMKIGAGERFELPVFTCEDLEISAVSIILKYQKNKIEIDPQTPLIRGLGDEDLAKDKMGNLFYKIVVTDPQTPLIRGLGDEIRIGWFAEEGSVHVKAWEPVLVISGRTTNNFKDGDVIQFMVKDDPLCEFADEEGNPIDNVVLKTYSIIHLSEQNIDNTDVTSNNDMIIVPNPAKEFVNVKYRIVSNGFVNISLYNIFGEKIVNIVNKFQLKGEYNSVFNLSPLQPGFYFGKMLIDGRSIEIKKIIIAR